MMTSTKSLGRMKPPADVSADIAVATARMPEGRIDDMKLCPSPISLERRSGSPVNIATRATEPFSFSSASGSAARVMKLALMPLDGQDSQLMLFSSGVPMATSPDRTSTSCNAMAGACGESTMT